MAPLLAISLGTLNWLAAVGIMATLLLAGLLLLNALAQRYWPQAVVLSPGSPPTIPFDLAAELEEPQKAHARAVQE